MKTLTKIITSHERTMHVAFWLFFAAAIIPVAGQDIDGTWFLNGFHTEVNANNALPVTQSITGTATINVGAGSISFSTNLGNWTEEDGFAKIGDTYRMVFPSTGVPEFMIAIRVIDEDTLAITMTDTWLDSTNLFIQKTEGFGGVLTRKQIPTADPQGWSGDTITAKGIIIQEVRGVIPNVNDVDGRADSLGLQLDDSDIAIKANPDGTSFRVIPVDEDGYADSLVQVGNALHWQDNDSSNFILGRGLNIVTRHVQTQDQARVLQLDCGRLAFVTIYNQRAIYEATNPLYNGIRLISEFEYGSKILIRKTKFDDAMAAAGLTGDDALRNAIPFDDGVSNVLKYAFNMNLAGSDSRTLTTNGSAGLPYGGLVQVNGATFWRLEYVRRKDSQLAYIPQKSSTLVDGSFKPLVGVENVSDISGAPDLQRVVVHEPVDSTTATRWFFRVKVECGG